MGRVETDHFTLTLISNQGVRAGSNNTAFTCVLGEDVRLDNKYKWDVGIKEISFPRHIDTLRYGVKGNVIRFAWKREKRILASTEVYIPDYFTSWEAEDFLQYIRESPNFTRVKSKKYREVTYTRRVYVPGRYVEIPNNNLSEGIYTDDTSSTYQLPLPPITTVWIKGYYKNVQRTRLIAQEYIVVDLNTIFMFEWDKTTRKVSIRLRPGENAVDADSCEMWVMGAKGSAERPNLGDLIGGRKTNGWNMLAANTESSNSFPYPANMLRNISYMDVRCSLAGTDGLQSSGTLGIYPLASWVSTGRNKSSPIVNRQIRKIHYFPCRFNTFSVITVRLVNNHGVTLRIDPKMPPTSIVLSFKRAPAKKNIITRILPRDR